MIESPINKKKTIKCSFCKKKCNMIHFKCNCNGVFCSVHRYTHMHNCNFKENKKEIKKEELKKNNPKIEKNKIDKI